MEGVEKSVVKKTQIGHQDKHWKKTVRRDGEVSVKVLRNRLRKSFSKTAMVVV